MNTKVFFLSCEIYVKITLFRPVLRFFGAKTLLKNIIVLI